MIIGNFINAEISSIILISLIFTLSDFIRSFIPTGFSMEFMGLQFVLVARKFTNIKLYSDFFSFNLIAITFSFHCSSFF